MRARFLLVRVCDACGAPCAPAERLSPGSPPLTLWQCTHCCSEHPRSWDPRPVEIAEAHAPALLGALAPLLVRQ